MKYLKPAALGSALALFGVAQAGTIVVDDFGTPLTGTTLSIVNPPGPLTLVAGPQTGFDILGQRLVSYTIIATGPSVDAVKINVPPYASGLDQTSDTGSSPDLTLAYSGFVRSLTANTLTLTRYNTDANLEQVQAWFTDGSANVSSSGWVPVAASHSGDLTLTLTGAANLADITGIQVEFRGDPGADFNLDAVTVVPEPSTYGGLAALGLLGTVIWRRARA
jgi:hypothetical protein